MTVVISAGNLGHCGYSTVKAPGNCPSVITVGASNDFNTRDRSDDRITTFSNRGPTMLDGLLKPDLVAPGNNRITAKAPHSFIRVGEFLVARGPT